MLMLTYVEEEDILVDHAEGGIHRSWNRPIA
jgi:hypothetical protein